jgi:hypothetical protein
MRCVQRTITSRASCWRPRFQSCLLP